MKYHKVTPKGMRDMLFKEALMKRDLEYKLCQVFLKRGFGEVITPTLEFYDVFDNTYSCLLYTSRCV